MSSKLNEIQEQWVARFKENPVVKVNTCERYLRELRPEYLMQIVLDGETLQDMIAVYGQGNGAANAILQCLLAAVEKEDQCKKDAFDQYASKIEKSILKHTEGNQ